YAAGVRAWPSEYITSPTRSRVPRFWKMLVRCVFTVRTLADGELRPARQSAALPHDGENRQAPPPSGSRAAHRVDFTGPRLYRSRMIEEVSTPAATPL